MRQTHTVSATNSTIYIQHDNYVVVRSEDSFFLDPAVRRTGAIKPSSHAVSEVLDAHITASGKRGTVHLFPLIILSTDSDHHTIELGSFTLTNPLITSMILRSLSMKQ
jgi:hypothetical protein